MVCKWSRILNAKMPRPHLFDPDMQLEKAIVTRKVGGKDQKCIHWSQAAVDGSVGPTPCPAHPAHAKPIAPHSFAGDALLRDGGDAHAGAAGE